MQQIITKAFQNKGLKLTAQRKAVVATMQTNHSPLTANEIFALAQKKYPTLGLATVYRTVEILYQAGLLRQVKTKYAPAYILRHLPESTIFCTGCGLDSPEPADLKAALAHTERELGYKANTLQVVGLCTDCSRKIS